MKITLIKSSFIFNEDINVWTKDEITPFMYSDGDEAENYLISVLEQTQDHSVLSDEIRHFIKDWPSLYHLSSRRSNLLQPFKSWFDGKRVLEIGCGCGAITRFLGETGATVISVEGSVRRARIARKRCADLENVTIICCPSDDLPDLGEFDAVLLIGVLEYAAMFLGEDGNKKLLQNCQTRLSKQGRLFIAIENKIGAKYLAGANEDHLSIPMVGINDAYKKNSVRTYARKELIELLAVTGFIHHEEFIPLPEYKLPLTIVSPLGVESYSSELSSLAVESVSADAQGVSEYNFSLEQFNHIVWKNDLAPELSNSFLIVAGVEPCVKLYDANILAWHYSHVRTAGNNKETLFCKNSNNKISVVSKYFSADESKVSSQENFLHGDSIWRELVQVVNTPDWTISDVCVLFKTWLAIISKTTTDSLPNYAAQISNDYFDALPFNIIKDDNGKYTIFDKEWDDGKTSDLGFIAWRGVFHSLFRIKSFEASSRVHATTFYSLTSQILENIWPTLGTQNFEKWVREEAQFSEIAGGGEFQSLLDVALNSTVHFRANISQVKNDKIALDNELQATQVHVNNLNAQIDSQLNQINAQGNEIASLREVIVGQQAEKTLILNSISWKVTRPLRFIKRISLALFWRLKTKITYLETNGAKLGKLIKLKKNQFGGYKALVLWLYHHYRVYGFKAFASKLKREMHPVSTPDTLTPFTYQQWVSESERIDENRLAEFSAMQSTFLSLPTISIVMPCYNAPVEYLRAAIESLIEQVYPNWELCIADDASTAEDTLKALREFASRDKRIKIVFREKNGHISNASNSAIALATGDFIALMDQDDLLPPHALHRVVATINDHPDVQLIYSDEDKISADGVRCDPYFKADWNRDLFLSQNMFSHLGVFRKEIIDKIGGFREGLEGSQDYDLVLRCLDHVSENQIVHIPEILYHWRIIPGSTASGGDQKPYAFLAGIRAVKEYLQRNNIPAQVMEAKPGMLMLRVKYELPENRPLVSIIIPTRNAKALIKQCIDSIREKTTYPHYEIVLIDNGSDEQESLDYFAELNAQDNITVIRDDGNFNFSRLNNVAAREAKGEVLCLMNNDIEIITPDWLDEMVSQALRPEIGAVGAKLLYPNDTVQHAGVILGLGGIAGHAHLGIHRNDPGYFGRANLVQNFMAVTAACLVIRKEIYDQVGGLNEKDFAVAFNDVDFCIRVNQAGYHNLWTPFAELYHHESATRGSDLAPEKIERFKQEIASMEALYGDILPKDPAYNVNLSLVLSDGLFAIKKP